LGAVAIVRNSGHARHWRRFRHSIPLYALDLSTGDEGTVSSGHGLFERFKN
jgi:hypothetical protein